jgi:hypothetical protein
VSRLTTTFGELLLAVAGTIVTLVREGFALLTPSAAQDERPIQDSDLIGDYNFRTQRFDSGNDPAGWYEDEA